MNIKMYFNAYSSKVIIKTNTSAHSLADVIRLFERAKQDYPDLREEDVSIKVYDDDRWNGHTGIEFKVSSHLDDYIELTQLTRN